MDQQPPHPAPGSTSPPPPTSTRPPLRRPRDGRVIAGVGAGLASHLGMDVSVVRIIIVVLALLSEGLIVLAYLAAAIFVPAGDDFVAAPHGTTGTARGAAPGTPPGQAPGQPTVGNRDATFWVGIVVVVVGSLWLADNTAGSFLWRGGGFGSLVLPLVLIAFGLALWRAGDRAVAPSAPTGAPTGAPTPTSAQPSPQPAPQPVPPMSSERAMTTDTTTAPLSASPPAGDAGGPPPPDATGWPGGGGGDWSPPPVPEPRERSLLARVTVGLALVAVGVLWLLRVSGPLAIGWGTILAAALLIVGLGLLLGSVLGRARSLIIVGALLAPVVLLAQVGPLPLLASDWPIDATTAGEMRYAPADLDELRDEYQLGAGSVRLDLRDLDLDGEDVHIRVDVGAGEIRLMTPDDVEVEATARAGIGQVRLFGQRATAGLGAGEQTATYSPDGPARGSITLELQVGIGEIRADVAPATTFRPDGGTGGTSPGGTGSDATEPGRGSDGTVGTTSGR